LEVEIPPLLFWERREVRKAGYKGRKEGRLGRQITKEGRLQRKADYKGRKEGRL
jgi:hypothetical protein